MEFNEKDMVKLLRLMSHDFLNHFQVIAGYIQLGRSQQALNHIKETVNIISTRHNLFRWVYPTTVLLLLFWQLRFFEEGKKLVVQSNTDIQDICVGEEQLTELLSSILDSMYAISTAPGGAGWLLKVEEQDKDYVFDIEYLGETVPEYDWSSASSQAERLGCRLEQGIMDLPKRLICPKGISWLVAE